MHHHDSSLIILTGINARYIHTSLGLRYLKANMGSLSDNTLLLEFVIQNTAQEIAEQLLAHSPRIIGFGVYIWNIEQCEKVISILKQLQPHVIIIVGGPEVSHETNTQRITSLVDYVITGPGDLEFTKLCQSILDKNSPSEKIVCASVPNIEEITLPYFLYTDEDIKNRIIYVEASRGCPFKCEFCLSSLDKSVQPFNIESFLQEIQLLYQRGARQFKFVDRTFNLRMDSCTQILNFFLGKNLEELFLHFEVVPDRLPEQIKSLVCKFPPGAIQFEIGVQTFNPEVQKLISRKQSQHKTLENISWLRTNSPVYLHTDLIVGLPGEDLQSFATGLNQLVALDPHEIQIGILKRLRGSPICRHTNTYTMTYNFHPPYNILCTNLIDFPHMQAMTRFARYWDIVYNSGRFINTMPLLLEQDPFGNFYDFSIWLYAQTQQTHRFALMRVFELLYDYLHNNKRQPDQIRTVLTKDFYRTKLKSVPAFLVSNQNNTNISIDRPFKQPKRQSRQLQ